MDDNLLRALLIAQHRENRLNQTSPKSDDFRWKESLTLRLTGGCRCFSMQENGAIEKRVVLPFAIQSTCALPATNRNSSAN